MKMSTKERASKAARVKNEKIGKENLKKYLNNPNICKGCNKPILPKDGQNVSFVKKKKFHNRKCFAIFRTLPEDEKQKEYKSQRKIRLDSFSVKSKKDFSGEKYFHSRIRFNSRKVYKNSGKEMKCFFCGYDIHVEICHIKDIKDFSKDSMISEINDLDNLIALCPNCHWEFDKGLIKL